jgi:hypothetical protein
MIYPACSRKVLESLTRTGLWWTILEPLSPNVRSCGDARESSLTYTGADPIAAAWCAGDAVQSKHDRQEIITQLQLK